MLNRLPIQWRALLQRPAIRASLWTLGAYGTSQALRIASNLILTRLLFKEAFGLMLIVNVVLQGFQMLSDLGIGPSVVQNPKGEAPEFLWTAWTIQLIRGAGLWVIALLLAWPLAQIYHEPMLAQVLPVISIAILIDAAGSTKAFLLNRRLNIGPWMMIDLSSYMLSILVMIAGAWIWYSVWPLVIGGLVQSVSNCIMSHLLLGRPRMRLFFDRHLAREIIHFGKWLFLSSILAYLASQLDRIIIGVFFALDQVGVYSVASTMSLVMVQVVQRISTKVLFPLYASTARTNAQDLRRQTRKARSLLMLLTVPPMWVLVMLAPSLIDLLYDARWHEAGWMLQLLAIGATAQCIFYPIEIVLLAMGNSFAHMRLQFMRTIILLGAMLAGGYFFGTYGMLVGVVAANVLYYPALVWFVRPYGVWLPALDLGALAASTLVIAVGLGLELEMGLPVLK
ncbi:MAG: lipopolysaccharide biosynthesis protein [Candidatus Hydrogenedentes bacterium]|nr:lipopolysaccharide biosynthesis protein [Candidatus Hydrogenedentota bacterium]